MERICVLMSTYNGEKYLQEQIDTLFLQKGVEVFLFVRDDGSTDRTLQILNQNAKEKNIKFYSGRNLKSAYSFFDLVNKAPDFPYYAFCDQDDVWLDDKLLIAINKLKKNDDSIPLLYYGKPRLVDSNLVKIESPAKTKHFMNTFASSIIESNATGCTMVFNDKLMNFLKGRNPKYLYMHDLWAHKTCLLCGGKVIFDTDVHILYRQHGNNVIGISNSRKKDFQNHMHSLKNKSNQRSKVIKSLYECYYSEMTNKDRKLCRIVIDYQKNLFSKLRLAFCFKIRTKYISRNIRFIIAVLLGAF